MNLDTHGFDLSTEKALSELKVAYVCSKHYKDGDIEYTHRIPNGDGTYREIPRKCLKLKDGAVPSIMTRISILLFSHTLATSLSDGICKIYEFWSYQ